MSFNHLTIELEVSNDITAQPSQEIAENQFSSSPCKIIAHAQIVENNFSLLLLLTSREHLLVQHKFGTSSRFASVAIKKLFPLKNCSPLSLVTITLDCFVVICISSDGRTIFLIPFCAFMDVTWSQKSTPLVCQPTTFSLLGFDLVLYEVSQLSTANCFQSSTDHTYLIFGDMNGSLIVANLNLRIIDVKIDFAHGICSIHTFVEKDGKRLLISFSDKTQMVFPFEGSVISVRETLLRITSSQAHQIANDLYIFPQLDGSVCVMNSSKNKLSLFDSFHSIWSASPRFCLDCFETNNVHRVICMPQIIAVLTQQNHLFVHLRFSQSDGASVCYVPKRVILPSEVTGKILQLIPSTNSNTNGEDALECFSTVTETGLFTLQTQRPLNDFVIAHLSSHFFSPNCLLTIADSLKSSPAQMCVSLLCHSLRNPSVFDIAQIDGVISLAFKCNVDPNEILFVLHKNSLGHLLLPFLRNKIGKDTGNDSLRQLFLGVILGRIAQISEEEAKKEEQNECQESEKDALECELRNFLLKFETDESEILLFSLRNLLFSCVYVFLFRNASTHSPTVVRFLLESSIWKSNRRRIANLLKCLSFIHWPSVDSFSAAVLAELLPLVPSFNFVQLKSVNKLTNLLAKRSIDSAHSFHLVCSLRLLHFSTQRHDHSKGALKMHGNSVDSGSNFTTLIGEDLFGLMMNNYDISDCVEFRPFFWGEFSAGTQRLLRNQQRKANGAQCPNLVIHSPKNSEKNAIADCTVDDVSATENRWRGRKRRPTNPFVLKSMPQAVQLPSSDLAFCAVACGTEHVLLLTFDGRLFSWGLNRYGQCGNGTEEPVLAPIEVKGKWGRIVSICAGHYHSGFISESDDIYLWGWGLHGQLGNDGIADLIIPSKSRMFTALGSVKKLCLGYSHTLALCADGRVFGCGALSYGQLGIDPHSLEGCPMKALKLVQLQFPMPISLIASKYFHGIALGVDHRKENVLFEWGDSPQSLKMKMFLQKRLFLKKKNNTMKENGDGNGHSSETKREDEALQRIHLHIRKICQWDGGPVKALSAGFNHSALLTADGHLFTWGKSLEMQLGHRNRKERSQPTKVNAPQCTRWSEVVCARNFTTAISVEGNVFVWGRNDKFQLGLGKVAKKGTGEPRTITFKSNKKSAERNVELPMDNCIETPTIVHGLRALVENEEEQSEKQWTETVRF